MKCPPYPLILNLILTLSPLNNSPLLTILGLMGTKQVCILSSCMFKEGDSILIGFFGV
jgi:hypothetical protein